MTFSPYFSSCWGLEEVFRTETERAKLSKQHRQTIVSGSGVCQVSLAAESGGDCKSLEDRCQRRGRTPRRKLPVPAP